jgi:hypothetical protein
MLLNGGCGCCEVRLPVSEGKNYSKQVNYLNMNKLLDRGCRSSSCAVENAVDFGNERFFDSLPSDVSFGSRPGESFGGNDDDHIRAGDAFMKVSSTVEVPSLADNLLLELIMGHVDGRFDEHDRGGSTRANHNTLCDKGAAHCTCVVLDGLGVAAKAGFRLDPIVVATTGDIPARGNLLEKVASMEVAITTQKRGVRAIGRVGEDDEFEECRIGLMDGIVVGDGDKAV